MQGIIEKEKVESTFVYADNFTIAGKTKEEHNTNYAAFMSAASRYNLQFNDCKTVLCVQSIKVLGYLVSHGSIKPDPDRVAPLLNLHIPENERVE